MAAVRPVGIAGLGRYVPERLLTNQDLEKMVDTSDEWIVQRTGIRERRIAAKDEITSTLALHASRQALEHAGLAPEDLELVICATVTGDQPFPATACRIGYDLGAKDAGGFDLASLNIQRGRDHGLPSYVQLRRDLGLPEIASMGGLTMEAEVAARLADVYTSVEQIDAWVGGLAEDPVPGALVGPTFHRILTDQFRALRDGDRFWYRNHLPDGLADLVEQQTLAGIIRRNTRIGRELPDDVWHVR